MAVDQLLRWLAPARHRRPDDTAGPIWRRCSGASIAARSGHESRHMLKASRELAADHVLLGLIGLGRLKAILAYVCRNFSGQLATNVMRVEFVRNIIKAMLGTDLGRRDRSDNLRLDSLGASGLLAIVWRHAIVCCTRVPAGEVDRGTIDVLLGLPISRWTLFS